MKTKEAYAEYLLTDHWRRLRQRVIQRDGGKCTRCPSQECLQAHHKFYRTRWEDAQDSDLITLCRPCHEKEHGIVSQVHIPIQGRDCVSQIYTFEQLHLALKLGFITQEKFKELRVKFYKPKLDKWVSSRKKLNRHQRRAKRKWKERKRRGNWSF